MSVKSRFWNSVNQDRPYDATDWAAWFMALITDGVCHEDDLKVTTEEASESGYAGVVQVGLGSAFIQGYMISVEGQPQSVSIQASSASANREDMIVARVSFADRAITILNKPGSPGGGAASLTRNGDIWEIGLAIITVESGATIIEARNIRDIRMDSRYCGLAGLRFDGNTDVTQFFTEWSARLAYLYNSIASSLTENQYQWLQAQVDNLTSTDYPLTLAAADWTEQDGVYTQTKGIAALTDAAKCFLDIDMSGATAETANALLDDYALIGRVSCSSGSATFYSYGSRPSTDLPVILRVEMFAQLVAT